MTFKIIYARMGVWPACMTLSVYHLHAWCPWIQKRGLGTLELESQMVVSHHMGAVNSALIIYLKKQKSALNPPVLCILPR